MWTNIFKIGDLHLISWFQFLPCSDSNSLSGKRENQNDAATHSILSSHLKLQNEGLLSSWTNSFVGPWDPSQGVHNPDEKIKLWLFLPGRHTSLVDSAKSLLSGLRVVTSGIWLAPGDSEEVAIALSHALRNRIERALRGLSYMRFGDVFIKCQPFSTVEKDSRSVQPAFEFIFSATEEAIYVHTIISTKNVRGLTNNDLERALKHSSSQSNQEGFSVIVASNGMRGRLTGCCPTDLVKQVYSTNSSNGSTVLGVSSQFPGCQLRGQSCYVEVTLGCLSGSAEKTVQSTSNPYMCITQYCTKSNPAVTDERRAKKPRLSETFPMLEKTLIFPVETVLVPIFYKACAKASLKRVWLRDSSGTSLSVMPSLWNRSDSNFINYCLGFGGSCDISLADSVLGESIDLHRQRKYNNRNCSNSSSISSTSSTSNNSDVANTSVARELEADADSLSCRQSGLSLNDQLEKDNHKRASKRSWKEIAGSFDQACNVASGSVIDPYTSNRSLVGFQFDSIWDWDQGRCINVDIVDVVAEYGSFDDFFEDDNFDVILGELPGTEESQTAMFSATNGGETSSSPCLGKNDGPEQTPIPFPNLPLIEEHIQDIGPSNNEFMNQNMESTMDTGQSSITGDSSITNKYDYLKRAEAMMTVIPRYSAVETPFSEFSISIFRTPYVPKSKLAEKPSGLSSYVHSTTHPQLISEEKVEMASKAKMITGDYDTISSYSKYYNFVNGRKNYIKKKSITNEMTLHEDDNLSSLSGITFPSSSTSFQEKKTDDTLETGCLLMSLKTVLGTELECSMYQASMRRIRHTLLFCNNQVPKSLVMRTSQGLSIQVTGGQSMMPNMISSGNGIKKKDSIPVRIAGDIDSVPDNSVTSPLGVWRVVAPSKSTKASNMLNVESSPFPKNNAVEDFPVFSRRQPLQELLDAISLLVQQSTSFVDVSLDPCDGDGSYDFLTLEEQIRRGFVCGPSSVHAGCGGVLASCHSVDIAGVDLVNPLSTDVRVSSVISLLHSEVRVAMRAAFGNLEGPLSVIEWCNGHNQSGDTINTGDIHYAECNNTELNDSSSEFIGEAISPTFASNTSSLRDGVRIDESSQRRSNQEQEHKISGFRNRPTISMLPVPSLLIGFQDDWLKTSPIILNSWEKEQFEPYALPKPLTYCAVCPDIDYLTFASATFLRQIGIVYESCNLGTHSPYLIGSQLDIASKKSSIPGLVLVDCPQTMKKTGMASTSENVLNDYLISSKKNWDLKSFLVSLANSLKILKLGSVLSTNQKDGTNVPTLVVYVVCPFPGTTAVLQTLVESCVALGSAVHASEKESRTLLHSQISKDLNSAAPADEASTSNVVMLSGFSIPNLVLQIVSLDLLLRVDMPWKEHFVLKDLAFTIYNKARRVVRSSSNVDVIQSQSTPGRSQSTLMHASSSSPGFWKDCLPPRISNPVIARETEHDSAIRHGVWDNSWQTLRTSGGLNYDSKRLIEKWADNFRCMFEPLFILAEPGSVEQVIPLVGYNNVSSESSNSRSLVDDSSSGYMQTSASSGNNTSPLLDDTDREHKLYSLHCCYGWTEDWRWLICIWTDSKGELLDSQIFPFGGISSRQDTKVLQCLFVQILQQGCQIISSSLYFGSTKLRNIIITRIGCFFELECQEWQRAIYLVGGNEVKKWPVQLRRSVPCGASSTSNGPSLQQQDISLIQERSMSSSSLPSMYNPHPKSSGYMKGTLGQSNYKKAISGSQPMDCSRGLSQLVQSISLIAVSVDHSLHLFIPTDSSSLDGINQNGNSTTGHLESFNSVSSLGEIPSSYMFIPTPSVRYLPPSPSQLPTCLTSESPPLAHLLHSKGSAIPLSTGYIVSKAVPSARKGRTGKTNQEWPSIISVTLIDHYGGNIDNFQEKMARGVNSSSGVKQGISSSGSGRISCLESSTRDCEFEKHLVLESISAELHSLSWMTISPMYPERRTALPFHCDMLLRLRRLLFYADKHLALQSLDK